jgi:hypothetical protein
MRSRKQLHFGGAPGRVKLPGGTLEPFPARCTLREAPSTKAPWEPGRGSPEAARSIAGVAHGGPFRRPKTITSLMSTLLAFMTDTTPDAHTHSARRRIAPRRPCNPGTRPPCTPRRDGGQQRRSARGGGAVGPASGVGFGV